jgi:hypothetical protein
MAGRAFDELSPAVWSAASLARPWRTGRHSQVVPFSVRSSIGPNGGDAGEDLSEVHRRGTEHREP